MRARTWAGLAAGLFLLLGSSAEGDEPSAPQAQDWGRTRGGVAVQKVVLRNALGMQVAYVDYGATLTAIVVPDRRGRRRNVVLSLPALAALEANRHRYGAEIGRYAGRIGGGRFTLDGHEVRLQANAKGVYLSPKRIKHTGFSYPSRVAVGKDGTLYVSDIVANKIFVFNSAGTWLKTLSTTSVPARSLSAR